MNAFITSFGVAGTLFITLVIALWAILPLAVFGIKKRLDTIIIVSKGIRKELKELNSSKPAGTDHPSTTPETNVNAVEYLAKL